MTQKLTRQALFDLVWSQPLKTLASGFGISDVALAKTCRRADIPLPERGYWAKRQAGKRVIQPSLPPRAPGMAEEVVIGGGAYPYYWAHQLTEEEILGPLPPAPSFPDDLPEVRARIQQKVGKVSAPRTLKRAHRLIARLLEEDERRREKQRASPYAFGWDNPLFDSPFERRRLRSLDGLFHALERAGCRPDIRGREARELSVRVGHQHVHFRLERLQRGRKAAQGPRGEPDGASDRLRLEIGSFHGEARVEKAWEDTEERPLERQLEEITIEMILRGELQYRESARHLYEWRVKRKAQLKEEARRRKAEQERQERERRAALEKARVDRLLAEAAALRHANDIRAYAEAVRAAAPAAGLGASELEAWSAWALAQADRIDPVRTRAFLEPQGDTGGTAAPSAGDSVSRDRAAVVRSSEAFAATEPEIESSS